MMYFPEIFYKPELLSMEELQRRFEKKHLVSFLVSYWNYEERSLVTTFGDGILGYLPEEEVCIDKLKFFSQFPYSTQTSALIGKVACALITDIKDNKVYLSRKKLQNEVLQTLSPGNTYDVQIKSISDIGAFVDIAVGINGFIHNSEISKTHFNSTEDLKKDLGLFGNKVILAKLLKFDERIELSYRQAYNFPVLHVGDVTSATVRNRLRDGSGYFVEITPNDTAIVDSEKELKYGSKVLVRIKSTEYVCDDDDSYCQHHVRLLY